MAGVKGGVSQVARVVRVHLCLNKRWWRMTVACLRYRAPEQASVFKLCLQVIFSMESSCLPSSRHAGVLRSKVVLLQHCEGYEKNNYNPQMQETAASLQPGVLRRRVQACVEGGCF